MILLLGGGVFGNDAAEAVIYFEVPPFRGKLALRRFSSKRCAAVFALDGNALVCCFGDGVNGINKSFAVPRRHGEFVADRERMRRGCFFLCRDNLADSGELKADDRAARRAPVKVAFTDGYDLKGVAPPGNADYIAGFYIFAGELATAELVETVEEIGDLIALCFHAFEVFLGAFFDCVHCPDVPRDATADGLPCGEFVGDFFARVEVCAEVFKSEFPLLDFALDI